MLKQIAKSERKTTLAMSVSLRTVVSVLIIALNMVDSKLIGNACSAARLQCIIALERPTFVKLVTGDLTTLQLRTVKARIVL